MAHQRSHEPVEAVVLDLDGTLVDSVYHHVLAWQDALREVGRVISAAHIHRAIGMGSDRLVGEVAGESTEHAVGDDVRSLHGRHFQARIHEIQELDGASDLLAELARRSLRIVVATSGTQEDARHLLSRVEENHLVTDLVTGADVSASKPAADLIERALGEAGTTRAVAVGDAVWDAVAAERAGIACVGLRSGGISGAALRSAGAGWVYDSPRDLLDHLAETPLGAQR